MEAVKKLQSIAVNFYHAMHKLDTYQIFGFHSLPKPISLSKNPKHYVKRTQSFALLQCGSQELGQTFLIVDQYKERSHWCFLTMFNNCIEFSEPTLLHRGSDA